jgi:hypothetical protein
MHRSDMRTPVREPEDALPNLDWRRLWLLYGLALLLALVPIFIIQVPPLVDLPNHMARVHIINHLESSPDLQKYYRTDWHLLAYQSFDIVVPPLARLFGLSLAVRVYTGLCLITLFGGAIALHRVLFGRFGLFPLAAVLFLYSFPLAWGFVSYLFSAGVALLLLAAWIASEGRSRVLRVSAFSLGALMLLIFHFFTFAVYAVLIASYELGRILRDPSRDLKRGFSRLVEGGLPFVVPCVLVLASFKNPGPTITQFSSLPDLICAVLSPTAMYLTLPDLAFTFAVLFGFWICWRGRRLQVSPWMRLPLLAMVVTGTLMPIWLFSVWGASFRIPTLLAFLAVAAMDLRLRDRKQVSFFVSGVFALLLFRVVLVVLTWHEHDTNYREFRTAAANIDKGSRVLALPLGTAGAWAAPETFPYAQLATLSVVDRDVYFPTLFAAATPLDITVTTRGLLENVRDAQQPLEWHPTDPRFAAAKPETIREVEALGERGLLSGSYFSPVDWSRWPEDYDYLIQFNFGAVGNPVPALLTPVAEGSFFTIFRIHAPQAQGSDSP